MTTATQLERPAFATRPVVAHAVAQLRAGRPIIVRDGSAGAELVFAAQLATAQLVAELVRHTGGFVCAAMMVERAEQLGLPEQYRTFPAAGVPRFCVSVDAADGVTTGISAYDRSVTLRVLGAADAQPEELCRAGHVVPVAVDLLRADRASGAQARLTVAVLLARAAGLEPVVASGTLLTSADRLLGASAWPDDELLRRSVPSVSVDEVLADR